jgi:hypothetical protein
VVDGMNSFRVALIFALWLPLCALPAPSAEVLRDPTRPPEATAASAPVERKTTGLVLQSVLLGKGRKSAIISGQVVPLGGKIGEAHLTHLTESQAVLNGPAGETTLRLTPSAEKQVGEPQATKNKPAQLTFSDGEPNTKESAGQK